MSGYDMTSPTSVFLRVHAGCKDPGEQVPLRYNSDGCFVFYDNEAPDVLFTHGLCCLHHRGLRSCRDDLAAHDVAHFQVTPGFLVGLIEHAGEFNDIFFRFCHKDHSTVRIEFKVLKI